MNTVSNSNNSALSSYIFLTLFRVLRPARTKYKLSINLLLVINSCYLYSKHVSETFCIADIVKFNGYYSNNKMRNYFGIIFGRGLFLFVGKVKHGNYYKLDSEAIQIIEEIHSNYNNTLYSFFNRYGIDL